MKSIPDAAFVACLWVIPRLPTLARYSLFLELNGCRQGPSRPDWLVFNDFHISPCSEEEVGELFGGQKVPCLLYYTQVSHQ